MKIAFSAPFPNYGGGGSFYIGMPLLGGTPVLLKTSLLLSGNGDDRSVLGQIGRAHV